MNPPRFRKSPSPPESQTARAEAATLALLLVNEHAEEIKQTTICMRQAYPGCRVEAVYSAEEALERGARHDWNLIVLDEPLAGRTAPDLLSELRRHVPSSVIVVQADHHDAQAADRAIRAGADLFLYKKSPAFLTELPIVARGALEQRVLRKELAAERQRHACLIEYFPGLLYELDADGRFIAIGAGVLALLGYGPQELVGTHYSSLLHPDDWQTARAHLHERRTGLRARQDKAVRLIGKHGGAVKVICQTTGLYSPQRQFLGTVGTMKHPAEGVAPDTASPAPHERPSPADPAPVPVPSIREREVFYPEQRQAARVPVQMEASLHLRDAAYPGFVRDISLASVYVVIKGTPAMPRDHPVRLDFFMDGAVLQIQGKIAEVRQSPVSTPQEQAGLGLVVLYPSLGAIEGPILSSLLEELRVQPGCAKLTIFPSLSRHVESS
jgi:PAS domain S-box-containing protein